MEEENEIMLQCFEWYMDIKGGLWYQIIKETGKLKDIGITSCDSEDRTKEGELQNLLKTK